MKTITGLSIVAGLLGTYLVASAARADSGVTNLKDRKAVAGKGRVPVLVELFTSEGCSSCPSADAELAELIRNQPVDGVEIVPLAQHVDYWNNIGWKDPFSSKRASARQGEYAQTFRLDSVYTPQMVVDGRAQFVGSDDDAAQKAIRSAAAGPQAKVSLGVMDGAVKVSVSGTPVRPAGARADVMLAITEDGLSSNVRAGENGGRRLAHVAVVRRLQKVGEIDSSGDFVGSFPLTLDKSWKPGELSAVAFVQAPSTGRVMGVAETSL